MVEKRRAKWDHPPKKHAIVVFSNLNIFIISMRFQLKKFRNLKWKKKKHKNFTFFRPLQLQTEMLSRNNENNIVDVCSKLRVSTKVKRTKNGFSLHFEKSPRNKIIERILRWDDFMESMDFQI